MRLSPNVRRATLVVHLLTALGWFGTVAAFLLLAIVALVTRSPALAAACYQAAAILGIYLILPLSVAALTAGTLQAAGTAWGLVRHWWVFLKLGMTIFAVAALIVHLQPMLVMADAARAGHALDASLSGVRLQLVVAPALALLLLGANAALGVVKPAGVTPFARLPQRR